MGKTGNTGKTGKTGKAGKAGKTSKTVVLPIFGGYRNKTLSFKCHFITLGLALLKFLVAPLSRM